MNDWTDRAAALADELVEKGKLRSREWIAAVRAVPRHALVPVFYEQDPTGEWLRRDGTDPVYHDRVYANRALCTMIGEETGSWGTAVVGLSSTSTPGLMTRMLETLDIRDGHDVLEIGTGTGYNAALLTHRLGGGHVFSVDIERDLVDSARDRLAALGYRPTLMTADGAHGLPEHAPYDRLIATCSVPAIPWAWIEQTRVGGLILTDLKLSIHAGNLVRLRRDSDRAEGRFDPTWAGFMPLRPGTPSDDRTLPVRDRNRAARRTTDLDQLWPWDNMVAWFLTPTVRAHRDRLRPHPRRAHRPPRGRLPHQLRRLLVRGQRAHWAGMGSRTDTALGCRRGRPPPVVRTRQARLGPVRAHRHQRPAMGLARRPRRRPQLASASPAVTGTARGCDSSRPATGWAPTTTNQCSPSDRIATRTRLHGPDEPSTDEEARVKPPT